MEFIIRTLDNYLSKQTDYALLINGPWGSGKTFYFKNTLKPIIDKTRIQNQNELNYKTVYISLYGIETLHEVENVILGEVFPILNTKALKIGRTVIDITAKVLGKLNKEDVDKAIHNVLGTDDREYLIKYKTLVVCFDDFERRGTKLELGTILGYINTLVEDGIKVLIIANEEKDQNSTNLKEIKEKTIGITVDYNPPFNNLLSNLISSRYNNNAQYLENLTNHRHTIEDLVSTRVRNLRTIIYWLDCYADIYSYLQNKFNNESPETQLKIQHELLKFSLAVAVEYRNGKINYNNKKELKLLDFKKLLKSLTLDDFYGKSKEETQKPTDNQELSQYFYGQYYKDSNSVFFDSIFSYLTTFDKDFLNSLESEVIETFGLKTASLPAYEVTYNLLLNNSLELSDEEYASEVKKLYNHVTEGLFSNIIDYVNCFILIIRYQNPLKFNLKTLEKNIISGARKANLKVNLIDDFVANDMASGTYAKNIKNLTSELTKIGLKNYNKILFEKTHILKNKLQNSDFSGFYSYEIENFSDRTYPYFKYFSPKKVSEVLIKTKPANIYDFNTFLEKRNNLNYKDFRSELSFFNNMIKFISSPKLNSRRRLIFGKVIETLQASVRKIETTKNLIDE